MVLRLFGEVDLSNAEGLAAWLTNHVANTRAIEIVIDLAGVEFCDLAGVRAMASAGKRAADRGIACQVHNPRGTTAWLLDAMRTGACRRPGRPA